MIYIDEVGHLITDGPIEELHEFAADLGLKRKWFQNKPSKHPHPHYDVTSTRLCMQAIKLGALPKDSRELVEILRAKGKDPGLCSHGFPWDDCPDCCH